MTGRRTRWLVVAALVGAVALSGCGSSGGGSASEAPSLDRPAPQAADPQAGGAEQAGGAAQADAQKTTGGAPAALPDLVPTGRSIVYTGSITVRVSDVDDKAGAAADLATRLGGFVGGDDRTSDAARSRARLVLRIPSEKFNEALTELGKLGTEQQRSISTDDVTEQVVDLDARIATAQASVDRVRALLARATTLGEIVQLEGETSRREADLAALKARQRKVADLVSLSTVNVSLLGEEAAEAAPETGFLAGLKAGWRSFLASGEVLLTVLGAVLPWFIALLLPVLLLVALLRRSAARRHRPTPAPDPDAS